METSVFRKSLRITRKSSTRAKGTVEGCYICFAGTELHVSTAFILTDHVIIWIFSKFPAASGVTELYCGRTSLHPSYSKEVSFLQEYALDTL